MGHNESLGKKVDAVFSVFEEMEIAPLDDRFNRAVIRKLKQADDHSIRERTGYRMRLQPTLLLWAGIFLLNLAALYMVVQSLTTDRKTMLSIDTKSGRSAWTERYRDPFSQNDMESRMVDQMRLRTQIQMNQVKGEGKDDA